MNELKNFLVNEFGKVNQEFKTLRTEMKEENNITRTELVNEINKVKQELTELYDLVDKNFKQSGKRLTRIMKV